MNTNLFFFSLTRATKQFKFKIKQLNSALQIDIIPVASVSAMKAKTGIIYLAVSHIQNPCIDYL